MFLSRIIGLIWLSIFCVVLLGGCDDFIIPLHDRLHNMEKEPEEKVDWVGTWNLESIDGVALNDLFAEDGQENVYGYSDWTFAADGNWWASFYFEFTIAAGSIGGAFWMEVSGTYVLDGANYVLNIDTDAPDFFVDSETNTGTWRIKDNRLTLIDDEGSVIVFYRVEGWDKVEPVWDATIPQASPVD